MSALYWPNLARNTAGSSVEPLFWLCTLTIIYVYLGYPMLLMSVGAFRSARTSSTAGAQPSVTLVVSAYNEASVIEEKLANALALDYPANLLDVLVVSDCSDDGTDEIVQGVDDPRVRLLRMSERSGKSLGLNLAVAEARSEILVFTDANAMFERDALRQLTRHFADANVGVVTGQQRYFPVDGQGADQEGAYWKYELMIKKLESRVGSLVGGDGAIMALRKSLYVPLEADDLSDFLLPLLAVETGHRNVYESRAQCYENGTDDPAKEFARKTRIVNRAWRAAMKTKRIMNPLTHGLFAVQLVSHKVLRWLVGIFLVGALLSNVFLLDVSWIYGTSMSVQLVFYLAALLGSPRFRLTRFRVLAIPYYFCLINYASVRGIIENYRGVTYATWTTARQQEIEHS